jgi:hypothetical protein
LRRIVASFFLLSLLVPVSASASGSLDGSAPARVFEVRWFNVSGAPLIGAEKDAVAQAIERRFNVKLILLGGAYGSGGYRQLAADVETNSRLPERDARRKTLPDVFPWAASLGSGPGVTDLFAPLAFELIKKRMPRTWTGIQVVARKSGMDPDRIWEPFLGGGVPCAIPQPSGSSMYPPGVVWREDILRQLGMGIPSTIEEWESVFRAYVRLRPGSVPWTNVWSGILFLPVFDATGVALDGFVERGGRIQSGLVQPEMRKVLATLQRWYKNHYIMGTDPGYRSVGRDTNKLFIEGQNIVTADALTEDGSWICETPYLVGSIQDQCVRRVPGASFVMAPRPVFAGVARAARTSAQPFGGQCFGFNKDLAQEPEKLARVMEMVEALANDSHLYLTGMFGIEGRQWTWDRAAGERFPRRLVSASVTANTGRYWIFPYTALDADYLLSPRVRDSISRYFSAASSLYGLGAAAGSGAPYTIPYADMGPQAVKEKARYWKLYNDIQSRFWDYLFSPVAFGRAPVDNEFDDFVAWYHDNGGEELEGIVSRWAGR